MNPKSRLVCVSMILLSLLVVVASLEAQIPPNDKYRKTGFYVNAFWSRISAPIMFDPQSDSPDEVALPEVKSSFGFSAGYEILTELRRATGRFGLGFVSASYSDFIRPSSEDLPTLSVPVTYQNPKYSLIFLDLAGHIVPDYELPVDFFLLVALGVSVESYTLISPANPLAVGFSKPILDGSQSRLHTQAGFGLGIRCFVIKRLAISTQYKWLYGEARTQKLQYVAEDANFKYYKSAGWDLKGPTGLFSIEISYLL